MIDTPSFQRLRQLKQLGLGHLTYPNASHTRFAHSLGVLAIMSKVIAVARDQIRLNEDTEEDLRLCALLHDVGHYPYSHLMERLDRVTLTEELTGDRRPSPLALDRPGYPDHEDLGRIIVTEQDDLRSALGGVDRATRIAGLFTRSAAADVQISKLIHSSLDMDRLDFLLRDARAVGVPYGEIDLDYLLNNLRASPTGMIGIALKALPAAEQFLVARYFMYRTVYYHKTTYGMEEALRQLLRRCRDDGIGDLPTDGDAVRRIARDPSALVEFTDNYADRVVHLALRSPNIVINGLARCIAYRRPPKLLREEVAVTSFADERHERHDAAASFLRRCEDRLASLASKHKLDVGLFLVGEVPPIKLEKRGTLLTQDQAKDQPSEAEDELIKVFLPGDVEPRALIDIPQSLIKHCASYVTRIVRLYVVEDDADRIEALRTEVRSW